MKDALKLTVIGAGSSYTPELMEGLIKRHDELPIREIWMVDVADGAEKMGITAEMARRMWKAAGKDVVIHTTLDRKKALEDADFVVSQFRVGQLDARIKDERIPLSYGMIGQETNGAGGIFKAFRTVPKILEVVEDMKEVAPDAWLINFTNPSGMITEAVKRYGHWDKVVGLCNVPIMLQMDEEAMMEKPLEEMTHRFGGLNHFHWHRVFDENGNEITAEILEKMADPERKSIIPANIYHADYDLETLQSMGLLPCDYHRYYYNTQDMLRHMLEEYNDPEVGTRGQQVKRTEGELFELYKDPQLDHKPEQLAKRGGAFYSDAACEVISSIYNDKKKVMVVSTTNNEALPDLPADCVVEVSARIGKDGAEVIPFGELPASLKGQLQLMKNMELLTVEAAAKGDYGKALEAFNLNPLIVNGPDSKRVLNELLVAHEKDLPDFADKIAELKETVEIKDPIVRQMVAQQV